MKKEGRDNNMPDHKEIYNRHANQYELLVSREDHQHNIRRTLNQIRLPDGLDVVEQRIPLLVTTDSATLPSGLSFRTSLMVGSLLGPAHILVQLMAGFVSQFGQSIAFQNHR
jgi:hypothetical protein